MYIYIYIFIYFSPSGKNADNEIETGILSWFIGNYSKLGRSQRVLGLCRGVYGGLGLRVSHNEVYAFGCPFVRIQYLGAYTGVRLFMETIALMTGWYFEGTQNYYE